MKRVALLAGLCGALMLSACGVLFYGSDEEKPAWQLMGFKGPYHLTHQDSLLLLAFPDTSSPYVDSFFGAWEAASTPLSDSEISTLDDTMKAVYELFDHLKVVHPQTDIDNRFCIRQSELSYCILDSASFAEAGTVVTLRDPMQDERRFHRVRFRPRGFENERTLYFDSSFNRSLNYFRNSWDGRAQELLPAFYDRTEQRIGVKDSFMTNLVPLHVHWCLGHEFVTYPVIQRIAFARDLNHAKVEFQTSLKLSYIKEYTRVGLDWVILYHIQGLYRSCDGERIPEPFDRDELFD